MANEKTDEKDDCKEECLKAVDDQITTLTKQIKTLKSKQGVKAGAEATELNPETILGILELGLQMWKRIRDLIGR